DTVFKGCRVLEKFKGAVLERLEYKDPFPELSVRTGYRHYVYLWEEVTDGEGSGMIHVAPGCGYDDYDFSVKYNLPVLSPLKEDGVYDTGYGEFSEVHYTEVNKRVYNNLVAKKLLLTSENYSHRYPHCWRCKEELVFRLVEEWFISTDEIRPLMQSAAESVEWKPKYVGKLFKDWVKNMGDWCVSRKRYWGLPLPFYECKCGNLNVLGSKKDLFVRAVGDASKVKELHRPWVDEVQVSCEVCGHPVDRVKEVGDCWLDAGVMPFSTLQYFNNKDYWKEWFPADFVCEMREQTRLWFYATMFMSVTLEGRPPYRTVVSYEKVHDKHNKPMHKSTGNAVWFNRAVEKFGADTLRLMYLAQNQSTNMRFNLDEESGYSRPLLLLWNVLKFFTSLADLENYKYSPKKLDLSDLDKWVYSELDFTVSQFNELLDDYQFMKLQQTLVKFMDNLSSWYVRRSRRRLWSEEGNDAKQAALKTLFDVLLTVSKLLAPLTPFMSEVVYQSLRQYDNSLNKESVHLTTYPTSKGLYDSDLRE
ncbi:MAG: class I tRNA ligase family protein, partial [Candidatus Heimdallarchaeota archaeon]